MDAHDGMKRHALVIMVSLGLLGSQRHSQEQMRKVRGLYPARLQFPTTIIQRHPRHPLQ
jgi:hypothetical protein